MDRRRGCKLAPDVERRPFVGIYRCCPPWPEWRDYLGALFDKIQKATPYKGRLFLNWKRGQLLYWRWLLYRRRSNRQAAAIMTIHVIEIRTSAATMEILARPSRAVRARTSGADGQTWTSSACWRTRKKASLGSGSLVSSQAELRPQYARAGTWYDPESNNLPAVFSQLVWSISLLECRGRGL